MRKKKKPDGRARRLRVFAWALALTLAVIGWILGDHARWGLTLELSAAAVFAVGTTWPYAFDGVYRLFVPASTSGMGHPSGTAASGGPPPLS
jgi:hypothetical protein